MSVRRAGTNGINHDFSAHIVDALNRSLIDCEFAGFA